MLFLIALTVICLILSFIFNKEKTYSGIKKGMLHLFKILPVFLTVLIIISIVLFFTPDETLSDNLFREKGITGYVIAVTIGSVFPIPGFVAFPLAGMLVSSGVSYQIIAVLITTLLMTSNLTIPIEKRYFGMKITLIRNSLNLIGAVLVGLLIDILWNLF